MATRMQQRRGTAAQWSTANPILAAGEIGFAFDTFTFKIGDGVKAWNDLENAYVTSLGGDTVKASSPGVTPLTLQGATGQTANLFVLKDGSGAVIGYIDPDGDLFVKGVQVATLNTAIMKTLVDAKGDLIVATAADTVARLAKGVDGQALLSDSAAVTGLKWGSPEAAPPVEQIFTASGTWTKPAGARLVLVETLGAGDGGQGGNYGTSSYNGGAGGAGGGFSRGLLNAADLAATEPVTVGAGGTFGAGATTTASPTNGSAGGQGGFSAFGSRYQVWSDTQGRPVDDGLTPSLGRDAAADDYAQTYNGGSGNGSNSRFGGGGGSYGGNSTSYSASYSGGPSETKGVGAGVAGGAGSLNGPTTAGQNGGYRQGGGGGGTAANAGPAKGGNGGVGGGGGGGGGLRTTSYGSKAADGGAGGRGEVRVVTFF